METFALDDESSLLYGKVTGCPVDFDELWDLHPPTFNKIKMFDKYVPVPRYQLFYLRDYCFSGVVHKAEPLHDGFKPFLEFVNSLGMGAFNGILVNFYENGKHCVGAHRDNERDLIPNSPVVTVSLGQTRTFRLRSYDTKRVVLDLPLEDGTYCAMTGLTNQRYTHEIVKGTEPDRRISITFRQFKEM